MEGILVAVALVAIGVYFHRTTQEQREQHLLYQWLFLGACAAVALLRLLLQ